MTAADFLPPDSAEPATVHPSSILRAPDDETRERDFDAFVADLRVAASVLVSH